ncbi:Unknown protein sequence [Pseudomonas syringae pv. primulae]|uniref:Uncharacterized protein n=1 Tax=Pseudomonas syringae pv. primulae TaxID=251707 RepID=A0A0Q0AQ36_9PSED|nr:Unknown protein sequence [Pseudomonas syringae pv. primulae]
MTGVTYGKRMGTVIHNLEFVPACDLLDCVHRARITKHMGADDCGGVFFDTAFNVPGRDVPGGGVDIGKDRPYAFPLQRAAGRHEAERRRHCTATQAQRAVRHLQGERAVIGQDDVPDPQVFLESVFKLAGQRTVIGQPAACIDPLDIPLELVDITKVSLGHVNHRSLHVPVYHCVARVDSEHWRLPCIGFRRRNAGLRADACSPLLGMVENQAGHPAATVWVTEMEDRRGTFKTRAAGLIGVQSAITPEQVDIAGLQFQYLGLEPFVPDRNPHGPAREAVLQQRLLDDVERDVLADVAQIGKQHQVAAFLSLGRDVDRNQRGHQTGVVVKAIGLTQPLFALNAAQHRKDLIADALPLRAMLIKLAQQVFEFRRRPQTGQQTFTQCCFTVIGEVLTGVLRSLSVGKGSQLLKVGVVEYVL